MPVARIITRTPAESEELRRVLTAAGYSVKFTAPEEQFNDADLVVSAANVHSDYALQYASEVAAEANADIVVAPGVIAAAPAPRTMEQRPDSGHATATPAAGMLFGTAAAMSDDEEHQGAGIVARAASAWQAFRQKRAIVAEQKRLENEHRVHLRQERERRLREQRAEAEARLVAERERLRVERAAQEERIRREQEEIRARDMERARANAEAQQARMAAEAEHARVEQERAWREHEQQQALEAERIRMEEERAREEQERMARDAALVAAAHEIPVPTEAPSIEPFVPVPQTAIPVARVGTSSAPVTVGRQPGASVRHKPARRLHGRQKRFQRAALIASVVTLAAMIALAIALNVHPSAPMPASVTNNPVQEQSPFGAASLGSAAAQPKRTVPSAQTKAAPAVPPIRHTQLPQSDSSAVPTKPSANKSKHVRRHRDNDVADDEVVIHHYGQQAQQKHPPSAQTRAGVPRYTDQ